MAYHSEFGGAKSAYHLLVSRGVPHHAFKPPPCVPRVLKHLMNAATPGIFQSIPEPVKLQGQVPRAPVVVDGLMRTEGLLNVYLKHRVVACPSVFSPTKWVKRCLSPYELLRAFDMPMKMDKFLLPQCSNSGALRTDSGVLPFGIENSVAPVVGSPGT